MKQVDVYADNEVSGITSRHSYIHRRKRWFISVLEEALAVSQTRYMTFVVPAGRDLHTRLAVDASVVGVKVSLYDAATGISAGSAYTPRNYARVGATPDANPPVSGVYNATVTTPGTALFTDKILIVGEPLFNDALASQPDGDTEFILSGGAAGKTYVLGIVTPASTCDLRVLVDCYDKPAQLAS